MRISDWSSDVCSSDLACRVSRFGFGGFAGRDRGGVHPHHFPDMAVGILEAAAVHEAEILRRGRVGLAARLDGLVDLSVDFFAAARRHAEQDLRMGPRVGDRLRRERSEEHTSELQSLMRISYAVFCLK